MIKTLQTEFQDLMRDIRELKAAQTKPSTFTMNTATGPIAKGRYTQGFYLWRICYEDVGDSNAPVTPFEWGSNWALRAFNQANNTQDIEFFSLGTTTEFTDTSFVVNSSRPISRIEQLTKPGPLEEWAQVRAFYPADMGTTAGWCLQNTRLGFHIYSGTFPTARADMESQEANGTLHSGTPPDYIAVPIYFKNYWWTSAGHIAAWDHGRIYSDGVEYPSIDSVATDYAGWGELCDGARVVQRI